MFTERFTESSKTAQLVSSLFSDEHAARECSAEGHLSGGGGSGGADCALPPGRPTGGTKQSPVAADDGRPAGVRRARPGLPGGVLAPAEFLSEVFPLRFLSVCPEQINYITFRDPVFLIWEEERVECIGALSRGGIILGNVGAIARSCLPPRTTGVNLCFPRLFYASSVKFRYFETSVPEMAPSVGSVVNCTVLVLWYRERNSNTN